MKKTTAKKLERLKKELKGIREEMDKFEIDPYEYEDQYCDLLDDMVGPVRIGELEYSASHVLKNVDPVAYRCGLLDYIDSLKEDGLKESLPEWKEMEEKTETLENEIESLIESLKEEIGEGE